MKRLAYFTMTLFAFSLFFLAAGVSPSQAQGNTALYGESEIVGWDTVPASGVIGSQLLTSTGDYLGVISDLVVDPSTGRILEAIISDVPENGARMEAIPFVAISHTGDGIFVLNLPDMFPAWYENWEARVELPQSPYTHWAELRYYYSVEPTPGDSFNTSMLLGAPVEASKGGMVARVNDFVIDFRNDQVVYTVLSDVGGMGDRMAAVPFNELSKSGGNAFTLNATGDKLMNAPAFSWTEITDMRYAQNIYSYYGVQPYWEER